MESKAVFPDLDAQLGSFDFKALYDEIRYKGFDQQVVLTEAITQVGVTGVISIAMLGTLRGTNTRKLGPLKVNTKDGPITVKKLLDSKVLLERKIGANPKELTIGRIAAAAAQYAAYGMMKVNVSPRIPECTLPGFCQFPGLLALGFDLTDEDTRTQVELVLNFFAKAFGSSRRPELEQAILNGVKMTAYKGVQLAELHRVIVSQGFKMLPVPA